MQSPTLLLVDDEPNILSSLRRLLRNEGYKLHLANSGEEALETLKHEQIDLVVSDGRMPGMSGTELLKRIKSLYPDTLRIILSGYTDVGELAKAINEGEAYRYILKPWNDEELKLTFRIALAHHRLTLENRDLYRRIEEQNRELKDLNAHLEEAVEAKTHELILRNKVLTLAQEILDHLPLPVVGLDASGTIVQANRCAIDQLGGPLCVGDNMSRFLPEDVQEAVEDVIAHRKPSRIVLTGCHKVTCSLLGGGCNGEARGATVTFEPLHPGVEP